MLGQVPAGGACVSPLVGMCVIEVLDKWQHQMFLCDIFTQASSQHLRREREEKRERGAERGEETEWDREREEKREDGRERRRVREKNRTIYL